MLLTEYYLQNLHQIYVKIENYDSTLGLREAFVLKSKMKINMYTLCEGKKQQHN